MCGNRSALFLLVALCHAFGGCWVWLPITYSLEEGTAVHRRSGTIIVFADTAEERDARLTEEDSEGAEVYAVVVGDSASVLDEIPVAPEAIDTVSRDGSTYVRYLYDRPGGGYHDVRVFVQDSVIELIEVKEGYR